MEVKDWITHSITNADSDRTQWQFGCIDKWAKANYRGTVEAATGTGKSRIGIHAIELLRRNNPLRTVLVVVPTRLLKSQWEAELKKWKLQDRAEVWVINSVIKGVHNCDLLIMDRLLSI